VLALAALRGVSRSRAAQGALAGRALLLLGQTIRVYGPDGADHLGRYAARVLHQPEPLHLAIHLGGPVRANRKPVVALLDATGDLLGYAKLGVTPLARTLVRNERAALRTLGDAGLRRLRIPRLRHGGVWSGHELIIQSALPVVGPSLPDPELVTRAMCELARACGSQRARLTDAPYWLALLARADRTGDPRLAEALTLVRHHDGGSYLEYGAWHGDWTPWNSHPAGDAVLLWDWERFGLGVPVGFDALHHRLAELLQRGAAEPLPALLAEAPSLLAPFGRQPFGLAPAQARTTAGLYLIEIATRYLTDDQQTTAARTVTDDLLPALTAHFTSPAAPDPAPSLAAESGRTPGGDR
ncbi:MAG: hypothetical protein ACRDT4_22570, partial [Micromonosporaceae bacterium]